MNEKMKKLSLGVGDYIILKIKEEVIALFSDVSRNIPFKNRDNTIANETCLGRLGGVVFLPYSKSRTKTYSNMSVYLIYSFIITYS